MPYFNKHMSFTFKLHTSQLQMTDDTECLYKEKSALFNNTF